jgi:chorismate synthase
MRAGGYGGGIARLTYTTAGESHGPQLTVVIAGMPAGLPIDHAAVDRQLARRQAGYGRSPRQRIETDTAQVTAGLRHGRTLGSPIAIQIANRDHGNWSNAMDPWPTDEPQGNWRDRAITLPRPGHADLAGVARAGFTDVRNVLERASARETAARVAAGACAQQLLEQLGIQVRAHVRAIGGVATEVEVPGADDWAALDDSELLVLESDAEQRMIGRIDEAKAERDTLGGVIEVVAYGVPPGIGSYTSGSERLSSRLAAVTMGVQAMKAVEVGDGFALAARPGSTAHDEMVPALDGRSQGMGVVRHTNHAGGLEGGMANGAPIVLRVAMKPLPTLMRPLASVDLDSGEPAQAHAERSDVCAVPAAAVVLQSVVAFELAAVVREQFGMQRWGDIEAAYDAYLARVGYPPRPRSAGNDE